MLFNQLRLKKNESGSLPEVDVDVDAEAGSLPEYDVDWAEVNVGTKTETIKVPKVVVVMEEEEVEGTCIWMLICQMQEKKKNVP